MDLFLNLVASGLVIGSIYGLIAISFAIIFKTTGVLNFAQGEVMMLIAYLSWSLGTSLALPFVALIVASIAFAQVFTAAPGIWLFSATLVAAASWATPAAADETAAHRPSRARGGDLLAGLLLALPIVARPLHLWLLPAFAGAAWADRRSVGGRGAWKQRLATLGAGLAAGGGGIAVAQWWNGGGLRVYGTTAFRFRPETGFPLVDFPAQDWAARLELLRATVFEGAPRLAWGFDAALWAWNSLYLLFGESLGLVPYFLPVALMLRGSTPKAKIWLAATAGWAITVLVVRPFVLAGGEAVANPLFLPLFAASVLAWTCRPADVGCAEPARGRDSLVVGAVLLLASAVLVPSWLRAGSPPAREAEGYLYRSPVVRALLPEEITQKHLPAGELVDHLGVRVRLASPAAREERIDLLALDPPHRARLWVVSPEPLGRLHLEFGADAPARLVVESGAPEAELLLRRDGGVSFLLRPRARSHPMWWTPRRLWIYRFTVRLENGPEHPLFFRIVGEPAGETMSAAPNGDRP